MKSMAFVKNGQSRRMFAMIQLTKSTTKLQKRSATKTWMKTMMLLKTWMRMMMLLQGPQEQKQRANAPRKLLLKMWKGLL